MGAKASKPAPAMEFQSDRLRLMAPLITPRVMELALARLMDKNAFFKSGALQVPDEKAVVKIALIVVREMNPTEDWDFEEEALLTGICSKTLRTRKADEMDQLRRLILRKAA